jgi:flagellum-specific peptidoglycan hydrolase FlgJ
VLNIQHPDVVYAQAVLESGNFKSDLFLRNNNLFGMGVPSNRRMLTINTKGKFSDYKANYLKGWQLSVIDYALWQDTYAYNLTKEEYLDYLSLAYAEDPFYVKKIIKIINNYEN